jgi:formylglycine-generating enzyme required for sulfatase activity
VNEIFRRTGADVSRASGSKQIPAIYSQFFETAYFGDGPSTAAIVQPASVQPTVPTERIPQDGLVRVEGGTFIMGSPASEAGRNSNETPHQVRVGSFYMGRTEVTQQEWAEVMGSNPSNFKGDRLPVENISWYDVIEYCNRRSLREGLTPAYTQNGDQVIWDRDANGYRLPTEAEWEYACRAGTMTPYSGGKRGLV